MPWTAPRTYVTGELFTAAIGNTHIRDNLNETAPAKFSARGDIFVASAANAGSNLPVGANNFRLTADSACNLGVKWAGGGGFSPFNAPPVANNGDDEFSDSSLSASWTEWDQGAIAAVSETAAGLEMTSACLGSISLHGIFKSAPASPYSIWSHVSYTHEEGTRASVGLLLGQDLSGSPATSDAYFADLTAIAGAPNSVRFLKTSDYTGAGAVVLAASTTTEVVGRTNSIFFRGRYANGSLYIDYSFDGLGWTNFAASAISFVPAHVGLMAINQTGASMLARSVFFRVTAASAFSQIMMGNRL